MDGFDPDKFLAETAPAPAAPPASEPAAVDPNFNPDMFLKSEELPKYANGFSPKTPINISPINAQERENLAAGNERGRMKWLSSRFSDVQRAKNGDYVVKDADGYYKRIDPEGLGDGNAWEMTKEALADISDVGPEIFKMASQILGSAGLAAATGGTSLAAQAGTSAAIGGLTEAAVTSFGRLVGTYDATPEEQLKDIGIESLLNMGGTYIAAGVKPTVGAIASGLKKAVEKVPGPSKEMVADGFGMLTGLGSKPFETLLENADTVIGMQKRAVLQSGGSAEAAVMRLAQDNIDDAAKIAASARPALSNYYGKLAKEVISNVDEGFQGGVKATTQAMLSKAEEMGLGKLINGKFIANTADDFAKIAQETGAVNPLIADEASLKIIQEGLEGIQKYSLIKEVGGKKGAQQVLELKRNLFDLTYKLSEQADDAALIPAKNVLAELKNAGSAAVSKLFEKKAADGSVVNLLANMDQAYSAASKELAPLMNVARQAQKSGTKEPFERLASQLLSGAGKNQSKKSAVDGVIDLVAQHGGDAGQGIRQSYQNLQYRQAASALMPALNKGLLAQAAASGGAAALGSGNPMIAAGLGLAAVARSPKLAMQTIRVGMAAKAGLTSLGEKGGKELLSNPGAFQQFMGTILSVPGLQTQVTNQLMQGAGKQIYGQGQ